MRLVFRKRVKFDDDTSANISTHGVSVSRRTGRITVNSRGRVSIRLLPGLSLRFGGHRR